MKGLRQEFDQQWSAIYRQLDEQGGDDAIGHYGALMAELSGSFGRPIDALDIGCGTGRYFHRLQNTRRLVGLDPSAHMLQQARRPTHADEVRVGTLDLLCGDVGSTSFEPESFDLVYSIGVAGEYAPLDLQFLSRCLEWLRPGGLLFVTAVDARSRMAEPENERPSLLRRVVRKTWPLMPGWKRVLLNRFLSPRYVTREALERLLSSSGFSEWRIEPFAHRSGWIGTHFDCFAHKRA
jgi:SAM-dependent methyltransferase